MKKFLVALLLALNVGVLFAAEVPYEPSVEAKLEYNRGVDYYKIAQYDQAISAFRQAINLDPNYIDAYYNLGSILEYLRRDEAALAVFKQVIVRKPDDYESVYKAANLSYKLGFADKAKTYLSLIPPESSAYASAQALANKLNTDMQTIRAEKTKELSLQKIEQTNGMYNDIPSPTGITTDNEGNVFVACFSDNMIYKISPDGKKIIFIKTPKLNGPIAMVSDSDGNIYVSNYNADNVIKISPTGVITTLISNVQKPYGIHIKGNLLFVSSQGSNSVLRYKL